MPHRVRLATSDAPGAARIMCAATRSVLGLPLEVEFQEIEGECLVLELRLDTESAKLPWSPSGLTAAVAEAAPSVAILSTWRQTKASVVPAPRFSQRVLAKCYDVMPPVADRALTDNLPTALWDCGGAHWSLAVPAMCSLQSIVGLSQRSGYTHRFTSLDVLAIQRGLAA